MAATNGQPQEWVVTSGTSLEQALTRRLLQAGNGRVLVLNKVCGLESRHANTTAPCKRFPLCGGNVLCATSFLRLCCRRCTLTISKAHSPTSMPPWRMVPSKPSCSLTSYS